LLLLSSFYLESSCGLRAKNGLSRLTIEAGVVVKVGGYVAYIEARLAEVH
jgi:hypothetical protein